MDHDIYALKCKQLTFISMINTISERLKKARHFFICRYFIFIAVEISCSVELSMKKVL